MFPRQVSLFFVFLSILLTTFNPTYTHAQETTSLPATVIADEINVRFVPSQWSRLDTRIGQLNTGDEIIVYKVETVTSWDSLQWPWVYMVHPASGLEGWVNAKFLQFERMDWQDVLPQVTSFAELSQLEGQAHQPYTSYVFGGAYAFINVRAEPYYGALVLGRLEHATPVEVVGTALINDYIVYVYVRDISGASDLVGWVWVGAVGNAIYTPDNEWAYALPVLQTEDVRHLPYAIIHPQHYQLRIRSAPSFDAPVISSVWRDSAHLYLHGRTASSGDGWVYVTVDDGGYSRTGSVGWIYDPITNPLLEYMEGATRASLPILTP